MRSDSSCSGGIVADMMGLGKTLTMQSAILCSKQLKQQYNMNGPKTKVDTHRLTISARFRPQTFKTQIFHGQTRAKDRYHLLYNDIVLATYHTLERDSSSNRISSTIRWSRIVLDESKSKSAIF
ncbi:unnamed protein product [Fusarium venenatum]|uniref:SNF2 N-terminal domain-containing protein n=1 Tax=Fusarium venenatum TaxID=56646 RepID=A0A2L2SSZ5_9HYPO|nr:uncharacterized protein FVRRES_04778 [Fusarium venenatum]CEI60342.1 unnamed protein product [Fusarium venenatum]